MERIVRPATLRLMSIKNVTNGQIVMPHAHRKELVCSKAEILGIYGQNGSGKTAVIDALHYLQMIMIGQSIPEELADYMDMNGNQAGIEADFHIGADGFIYEVTYTVAFRRKEKTAEISRETLSMAVNDVLYTIIPGVRLEVADYGRQMTDCGEEGIIKIISILNALIQAFGNPSICLAIDELDAGVFEYMLGELLDIYRKSAKGQLLFTLHNLRAFRKAGRSVVHECEEGRKDA